MVTKSHLESKKFQISDVRKYQATTFSLKQIQAIKILIYQTSRLGGNVKMLVNISPVLINKPLTLVLLYALYRLRGFRLLAQSHHLVRGQAWIRTAPD